MKFRYGIVPVKENTVEQIMIMSPLQAQTMASLLNQGTRKFLLCQLSFMPVSVTPPV